MELVMWSDKSPYRHIISVTLKGAQRDKFDRIKIEKGMTEAYEYAIRVGAPQSDKFTKGGYQ